MSQYWQYKQNPICIFGKAPVFKWHLRRIFRRALISITKTVSQEIGALICCTKCLSPETGMECYFHVWVGASNLLLGNVR